MFKCQLCKQVTPAKTKAKRVVLETRPRIYKHPADKRTKITPPDTYGREIVREVIACPECAAQYNLQKDKA
ncbi:MAG: hypothetical protein LCI00_29785 [Chloroflexi bacterium]|nr:hypothetical protein [Chloroflexota bacterium]MCC6893413.1 hypothetical protein [Anaerolineae bacterium]